MGSAAVKRQRRYLQRQQSGEIVLAVVVNEADLGVMLERAQFLPRDGLHTRADLQEALQRVVDTWLSADASIDVI
jgi:hypothetical protein